MDRLVDLLKAGADPTRVKIVSLCRRAELSVGEIARILGQSQPRVSRHLKILAEAGLLERYREGQFALFRLAARGPEAEVATQIAHWADSTEGGLDAELTTLRQVMGERASAAARYFANNAAHWDVIRRLHIGDEAVERAIIRQIGKDRVDTLVDLGTGTGRMIELVGPRANKVVGIDLSRDMLAMARGNLFRADAAHALANDWQVRQGDVHRLPLETGLADIAIMHQVLHFLENPAAALIEARRIIKQGGRLILVDFARHDVEALRRDHAHTRLGFADEDVCDWLRTAGFDDIAIDHLPGDPLTVTIWTSVAAGPAIQDTPSLAEPEGALPTGALHEVLS